MSPEAVNAAAAVATFVVIAISAVAAVVQLRHIRLANQLGAVLTIFQIYQTPDIQRPMDYVRRVVPEKLRDPIYLHSVEQGIIEPEVRVMIDLHEQLGYFLRQGLIHESFLGAWSPTGSRTWDLLSPIIKIGRDRYGENYVQYFEYFAARERDWTKRHGTEIFPRNLARLPLRDPWDQTETAHAEEPNTAE